MSRSSRGRAVPPAPAPAPAPLPELPEPSSPVVVDKRKAKGRHLRILAELQHIRTEADLSARIVDLYDLVDTLVEGGLDERPATDFWPAFLAVRRALETPQGN